jgi:hypothetical protein
MELSVKAKQELDEILKRDYNTLFSDAQISELGFILLRLSKLSFLALARMDDSVVPSSKGKNKSLDRQFK